MKTFHEVSETLIWGIIGFSSLVFVAASIAYTLSNIAG